MNYDWASIDRYINHAEEEDVRTILRLGLTLSQTKDKHGNVDVDAAADLIALGLDAAYVAAQDPLRPGKGGVWYIWDVIGHVIELIPRDDEPALAALIQGLIKLQTQGRDRREIKNVVGESQKVWADLPDFATHIYEIFGGAFHTNPEPNNGVIARQESWTAFLARINATGAQCGWHDIMAFMELREALEIEPPQHSPKAKSLLWLSTEWILHSSEVIYECLDVEAPDAAYYGYAGLNAGPLFTAANAGQIGFSRDRWVFWRKRFGELSGTVGDKLLEARITEAMRVMDEITASGGGKGDNKEKVEGEELGNNKEKETTSMEEQTHGDKTGTNEDSGGQ